MKRVRSEIQILHLNGAAAPVPVSVAPLAMVTTLRAASEPVSLSVPALTAVTPKRAPADDELADVRVVWMGQHQRAGVLLDQQAGEGFGKIGAVASAAPEVSLESGTATVSVVFGATLERFPFG